MFENSIDNKPFFTKPDGTVVRDLTQSMFDLNNLNFVSYSPYRVPADYVMRPDLISKAVYNNTKYAEIILKFNGISNPFSINEGDLILIPDLDSAQETVKKTSGNSTNDIANKIRNSYKYIDPLKIPSNSKSRQNFDNRNIKSDNESTLPPNIASEGESQITHRNGRVYFGEGVETCLNNGMTASEFLTTVINNKK